MTDITWLNDSDYRKAEGQLRGALRGIFMPFNELGHHIYIPGAIEEIVEVAIDFSKRVRGEKDQPIRVKNRRNIGG